VTTRISNQDVVALEGDYYTFINAFCSRLVWTDVIPMKASPRDHQLMNFFATQFSHPT
jgi:hypothetical protein